MQMKALCFYLHFFFDYCEPHTCDFNNELGEQNSQRI